MAYRTEIERALDEMVSDEGKQVSDHCRHPCPAEVAATRSRVSANGMAGSTHTRMELLSRTGKDSVSPARPRRRSRRSRATQPRRREHYPDVRVLIFATTGKVTEHTKAQWAKEIADEFGLLLQVISREEFVVWLLDPANSDICRDQLGIAPSITPDLTAAYERAREAAKDVAANWDRLVRRTSRPLALFSTFLLDPAGGERQ